MKQRKELKGGILPILGLLAMTAATEGISAGIDYYSKAEAEKKQREAAMREREAQIEADIQNRRIAGENAEQARNYVEEITRQQKQATNEYRNNMAAAQREFLDEQRRMNQIRNQEDIQQNREQLQYYAELSKARLGVQQQSAADVARIRGLKQVAAAQMSKQRAPQVPVRRVPQAISTALRTRRGRGYDNEILGLLQSYYDISLKDAKKLYKQHF